MILPRKFDDFFPSEGTLVQLQRAFSARELQHDAEKVFSDPQKIEKLKAIDPKCIFQIHSFTKRRKRWVGGVFDL